MIQTNPKLFYKKKKLLLQNDGAAYLSSFIFNMKNSSLWENPRGKNLLDSGAHFYETYKTKDNRYMAV